jgi:hypothetical protein
VDSLGGRDGQEVVVSSGRWVVRSLGAIALATIFAGTAGAGTISDVVPTGTLQIGGSSLPIDSTAWAIDPDSGEFELFAQYITSEGSITISGGGNLDPIQAFAASVVDFGAPTTFSFTFSAPIVLPNPAGFVTITGDISGSFSEGTLPLNGGSVTVVGGTLGIAEWDVNGTFLLGNGGSHVYPTPPPGGPFTDTYPIPPQASLIFDCSTTGSGTCDTFSSHISFTGGGGGYAFTTTGTINNVPEPAAGALLGLAGLAFALRGRRQRVA